MLSATIADPGQVFYRHALVMRGLVPHIHVFCAAGKTWMAGTSPAMTPACGSM
jgi:hypothetical protein